MGGFDVLGAQVELTRVSQRRDGFMHLRDSTCLGWCFCSVRIVLGRINTPYMYMYFLAPRRVG